MVYNWETHFSFMSFISQNQSISGPTVSQSCSYALNLLPSFPSTASSPALFLKTNRNRSDRSTWLICFSQKYLLPKPRLQYFLAGESIELSWSYPGSEMLIVDIERAS